MVRSEMVTELTVGTPGRLKTRSPRPVASITVDPAPAPWIVVSSVISRSPVASASSPDPVIVSLYVPAGTLIVSAPASPLAAPIASRSEQSESQTVSLVSAVFVTFKVAACAQQGRTNRVRAAARTAARRVMEPLSGRRMASVSHAARTSQEFS